MNLNSCPKRIGLDERGDGGARATVKLGVIRGTGWGTTGGGGEALISRDGKSLRVTSHTNDTGLYYFVLAASYVHRDSSIIIFSFTLRTVRAIMETSHK
jgi:hypothetical protein